MLRKVRLFYRFSHCGSQSYTILFFGFTHPVNGMFYRLCSGFCKTDESPELPIWVKFPQGENCLVREFVDDFTLPSLMNQIGNRSQERVNHNSVFLGEIVDECVDKISRVLRGGFDSTNAVVQAVDSCNINVSKNLVDKILKRFSNDWIPAFGLFRWAHMQVGYNHSADTYDTMIDILGKAKQFDLMWILIEEMVGLGNLVSLITISKIMRRLTRAGRWMDAIDTFDEIERFGLRQDTSSMNILLDTLCKERSVEHAQAKFLKLRGKISPDAHSFNILIHGWCKARKLDKAYLIMEEMKFFRFNPCVVSYTSLIEAYCSDKNFRKVEAILDEMQANGCRPNVVTYTIVMHALGKAKHTHEALDIFEKMKKNGCSPDTSLYNSLIYILGKAGRIRDAHDLFNDMLKNGICPNVTTYDTLISSACEHSQEEQAFALLKKLEESSCTPNIKTYAPLLKMCCKRKRMKTLQYLLNDMFTKSISLDLGTYTLLVHGLCRIGKLEQSCFFFEEMVRKGFLPKQHTYDLLIEVLERKNIVKAKEKIQELMVQVDTKNASEPKPLMV